MTNRNKFKFSIIIVSLNTKNDFLKTLASVTNQSYDDYEIIVVDGDSNDGTIKEIFKRKKIITKYIIGKDKGIYHAMNKGIKISSGKWIIFMNSGDIFFKKNTLYNFILGDIHNCDVVYGDTSVDAKNLKYIVKSKLFDYNTLLMPFNHQSVFVKSHILKKKNFSLKYKFSSDFDFFYYCFLNQKKFKKIDSIISKVKSGGSADCNRQEVFNENIMIINKKGNKSIIYRLYLKKINQYFKDFLKIILPSFFQKILLKQKYKNNLTD